MAQSGLLCAETESKALCQLLVHSTLFLSLRPKRKSVFTVLIIPLLNNLQSFHFEEEPIILNELTSDFSKKCLNYDIMKDMIFPNKISLYYLEEDLPSSYKEKGKNKEKEDNVKDNFIIYEENEDLKSDLLKTSCVIFSSNPQTENNSKKSINGFAYIFYKKLKRKKFTAKKI